VCTMTGLVLAVSGVMGGEGVSSACLPTKAFQALLPGGGLLVTISLTLFAFSTILAWGYYGEKCFEYLLGENWVVPYRVLFVFLIIPGSVLQVDTVWAIADISNAFMVLPNLIALLALYPAVREETDHFLKTVHKEIDVC
ncbi:MAG: alanine:cation symporter family protein, partial [Candidatus Omnitrophica bacterium]|nr:alanine:cation symporter family protein [Candidatus Omnitrophota bacterium]